VTTRTEEEITFVLEFNVTGVIRLRHNITRTKLGLTKRQGIGWAVTNSDLTNQS
jgi:hypothetical protein